MKLTQILYKIFTVLLTCILGVMGGGFAVGFCKELEDEPAFCFCFVIAGIAVGVSFSYLLCCGLPRILHKKADDK
jgi:hypothetical protein